MGVFNGMFPIVKGKEDAARKFAAEAIGARKADFAARINVTPQMISAYCAGRMWPGKERMEAIARETFGDVTANDFITMPDDSPSEIVS